MPDRPALLIVDDEKQVLQILKTLLEEDYTVYTAGGGMEALGVLRQEVIQVILTDERMPHMTGLEFLAKAREMNGDTVNILMTAYSDIQVAIDAINQGLLYRYLVKPWESDVLATTIRQAFERERLQMQNRSLTSELIRKNESLQSHIVELGEAQKKISQQERLTTLGQLTAGLGHELKNPLSRIKSAADLLEHLIESDDPEIQHLLKIVQNEVLISSKIITDLLDYTKSREPILSLTYLDDVIDAALSRTPVPEGVEVQRNRKAQPGMVLIDAGQIQQVVTNFVFNSVQALPEKGGLIRVDTSEHDGGVEMVVEDNGCGMSEKVLERMFEPLFTTKTKGIGLGMCIVKTICDHHKAQISVKSREQSGTRISVTFPKLQDYYGH